MWIIWQPAGCFIDRGYPARTEHRLEELRAGRICGLSWPMRLRRSQRRRSDPLWASMAGKAAALLRPDIESGDASLQALSNRQLGVG